MLHCHLEADYFNNNILLPFCFFCSTLPFVCHFSLSLSRILVLFSFCFFFFFFFGTDRSLKFLSCIQFFSTRINKSNLKNNKSKQRKRISLSVEKSKRFFFFLHNKKKDNDARELWIKEKKKKKRITLGVLCYKFFLSFVALCSLRLKWI